MRRPLTKKGFRNEENQYYIIKDYYSLWWIFPIISNNSPLFPCLLHCYSNDPKEIDHLISLIRGNYNWKLASIGML